MVLAALLTVTGPDAGAHAGIPRDERLHASANVLDTHVDSRRSGALT
jgi:hypothetical protein